MTEKKPENKETKKAEKSEEKPLEKMTVVELREIAKAIEGVTGVHAMKKDELLATIKTNRGIDDKKVATPPEKPLKKASKKAGKGQLTHKQMKDKVIELRKEKTAARQAKDKNKVNVLRRRINRLKKRTRKAVQG